MLRPKRFFWLAVVLQILLLLGMVGRHGYTLMTGTPIKLQTLPVDPWDPFRGQYVQLNYAISNLEEGKVSFAGAPYRQGQAVWVTVAKGDPFWTAVAVSAGKPAPAADTVALRGTVQWTDDGPDRGPDPSPAPGPANKPVTVFIHYGIEQFYVPEGQGKELEGRPRDLTVEALVDPFGRAALNRVFLEGKEIQWR
jgi:uncharacterized membrane-anchored protein